ncbi:MAG: hypothetical protein ACYCVH_02810 [Ignavibacteriaceae bacterium]
MKPKFNGAKMMKQKNIIQSEYPLFLNFLKAKFPVFHNSNIFFRDIQYGVMKYLDKKGEKVSYPEAEVLAEDLTKHFEEQGIFVKVNDAGWKLNYPGFVTAKIGDPL